MAYDGFSRSKVKTPITATDGCLELQMDGTLRGGKACKCAGPPLRPRTDQPAAGVDIRRDGPGHGLWIDTSDLSRLSNREIGSGWRWRRRREKSYLHILVTVCLCFLLTGVQSVASDDWDRFESVSESIGGSELESLRWVDDGVRVGDGLMDTIAFVGKAFSYRIPAEAFQGYVDRYEVSYRICYCFVRDSVACREEFEEQHAGSLAYFHCKIVRKDGLSFRMSILQCVWFPWW